MLLSFDFHNNPNKVNPTNVTILEKKIKVRG